jgi:hypothetical protein
MSRKIQLTQGKFAIVDDADYEWLNQWKWYACADCNTYYAVRQLYKNGKQIQIRMHREVLGLKYGDLRQCDHRDSNGLNNRRSNLRIATSAQNQHNQRYRRVGTSKFKGVHWNKLRKKWRAKIGINDQQIYLGSFNSEIEAAKTYDKAAKMFFGEFAHTNF